MNSTKYALRSGGWRSLPARAMKGLFLVADNAFLTGKKWERFQADKAPQNPMPWLPYCLTTFLDARLPRTAKVLEFGGGWGSIWWDQRQVVPVTVIEHEERWAKKIGPRIWNGCSSSLGPGEDHELIIVDSHPSQRAIDLKTAKDRVSPDGVIVLDDTHRAQEACMAQRVMEGWKSIYWEGLGPWSHQVHGATLFYREGNLVGI